MHFAVFFSFAVCLQQGLALPTGYAPEEWKPVQTYDRGEDLSLLQEGSGDIDTGSGDIDDGSGDILPEPLGGFSQIRIIQYSIGNKQTSSFFEAAVAEVLSEDLSANGGSTEQVTVKVNDLLASGDDVIVEYSVEVSADLWPRAKTDAALYDNQKQFQEIFGSSAVVIPHVQAPKVEEQNKISLQGVTREQFRSNELAFKESIADSLNTALGLRSFSSYQPKAPYHADNVMIDNVMIDATSGDETKLIVFYYVAVANGNVTPVQDVNEAVKAKSRHVADSVGASDAAIIEPDASSEFPSWAIAGIVVGGLMCISLIAVVSNLLVKRKKLAGYEDLDMHANMPSIEKNRGDSETCP